MAYQTRGREPLFDSTTAEAIEKRGKELLGLALLALALAAGAVVLSYSPTDPNWMAATDAPVRNWLGTVGAGVAAPVFMIIGWGGLGLSLVPGAWGLRLMLHFGEERATGRLIFAPVWLALLSLHAATLTPGADWLAHHSFGLGGLFGDTVLGALLGMLPLEPGLALRLVSALLGAAVLAAGLFVLGFSMAELRRVGRFLLVGLVLSYAALRAALATGAGGLARAGQGVQARLAERRAVAQAAAAEGPTVVRPEPSLGQTAVRRPPPEARTPAPAAEKPGGLLARMPALLRKPEAMPAPELVEPQAADAEAPSDDRIRARISDAIRSRVQISCATPARMKYSPAPVAETAQLRLSA